MSTAMFLTYRISSVAQRPVRSGLPSGRRGAGALRSTSPVAARGVFRGGALIHCASAGTGHAVSSPTARSEMVTNCITRQCSVRAVRLPGELGQRHFRGWLDLDAVRLVHHV